MQQNHLETANIDRVRFCYRFPIFQEFAGRTYAALIIARIERIVVGHLPIAHGNLLLIDIGNLFGRPCSIAIVFDCN
jgi:hypothetical protein